ncbi:cyclic nucleotide-binding domain-containing protein [Pseudanabaena yagii]|uniref:Cyclic nucleotide-binding domain-containing protein n=1 Tax=Pseudanabaena yagii GIHE-NHR1 TaxID=2722753 RepID=A0ABX1LVY5_9CYAN|nr:cyclic nucleotide-binding domain-containing protein [Pseudanabaena yagii]NMF59631.1 cyclic nucleotide-binding domain-containing protein [Pseudanabaena yagii GIHE-NHR1]
MWQKVSEKQMHYVRWLLAIGWLILIFSMFYDPISHHLTDPNDPHMLLSPFRIKKELGCVQFQNFCNDLAPYAMGARIFWGMIVPLGIFMMLVFGHEAWRRICPLMFLSQIPRALGWQRRRRSVDPLTNTMRSEPVVIAKNSWLGRNSLYMQFGLLFLGLNVRLLFVNSDRLALGVFLCITIFTAITVGFLYAGKSWCQYFCPMAPVQNVYTGPRGLMASEAHQNQESGITQSMCRTVDRSGKEKSACVSCQSPCFDIDAERAYWDGINRSDRKLLYYGYVGLVIGFYAYFTLYSGNPNFLAGGVWGETNQFAMLFQSGFYIAGQAIPIPKILAVPLTLTTSTLLTYVIGRRLERIYKRYAKRRNFAVSASQIQHRAFTLCAFISFNLLFWMGVNPTLGWLPPFEQQFIGWFAVIASTMWFYRTFGRSSQMYARESLAASLRRQLSKFAFDFSKVLEGQSLAELKPDEVYVLAKTLPDLTHEKRVQMYKDVLKEALNAGNINSSSSLEVFDLMRQQLDINEEEHNHILGELGINDVELLSPSRQIMQENESRLGKYRHSLELMLRELVESDLPLNKSMQLKEAQILAFRQEYNVTAQEETDILASICKQGSLLDTTAQDAYQKLQTLTRHTHILQRASNLPVDVVSLLVFKLQQRQRSLIIKLLRILEIFGDVPEAYQIAKNLEALTHKGLAANLLLDLLHDETEDLPWHDRLPPQVIAILNTITDIAESRLSPTSRESVFTVLVQLMEDSDTLVHTGSLYALKQIDLPKARVEAQQILSDRYPHTLLSEEAAIVVRSNQHNSQDRSQVSADLSSDNLATNLLNSINNQGVDTFEKLLLLFRNSLFRPIQTDALAEIARYAEVKVYQPNEVIYQTGDLPKTIWAVINGSVEIRATGSDRRQRVKKIAPNQTIGQLEVLTQKPFTNLAIATSPETLILAINAKVFMQALREDPLYTQHLLISVSTSLQSMLSSPMPLSQ